MADCSAFVEAVKAILPLGSQEWGYFQDCYNLYAAENNWATQDLDPLKMKFCALVNHVKPTGDPDCPTYLRDTKVTQKAMDLRPHVIACNNPESDNDEE